MSTNSSFNPPSDPPCSTDVITAAAAVALRDAGGLDVRCHYFVQGPTIGTPGNTSPTVVELHAVTASSFSKEAKVQQTFNPEGAFLASYDPDADTAGGGTLNELVDHWNNVLSDEDPGNSASHVIHNQWPFHLSGTLLRDNVVNDTDLPGLAAFVAAGGAFTDNDLQESTVDLTGVTSPGPAPASFFRRNQMQSSTFTANCPTVYSNNNTLSSSGVQHLGASADSFSFQGNTALSGTVSLDAATTSQVTMNNNVIGGTSGGYRITAVGHTGPILTFSGNRVFGASLAAYEFQASGTGTISVTANDLGAGTITANGPGNLTITGAKTVGAIITQGGTGNLTLTRPKLDNATVSHLGGGLMSSTDLVMSGASVVRVLAGQAGSIGVGTSHIRRGYVVEVAGTSTATFTVSGSVLTGHTNHASGVDLLVDGAGVRNIADSRVVANTTAQGLVLAGAGGTVGIGQGCDLNSGRIVRDPAATANLTMVQTRGPGVIQQGAGATVGTLTLTACTLEAIGLLVNQQGPGSMFLNSSRIGATVQNSATATRGLSMSSCDLQGGSFSQNRTGGTGVDTVSGLVLKGVNSSVTLAGAADPGATQTPVNVVTVDSGSRLTLTDPVGSGVGLVCLQNSKLEANAIVSGTGTGLVSGCRFAANCTVNLGAFSHSASVVEGNLTVTPTAGNTGKLANAAFNSWV